MKVAIGSDHAGFELKEQIKDYLEDEGYDVTDVGALRYDKDDDYPDFARSVAHKVAMGDVDRGILVCDTGIGVDIAANKVPNVRSALVHDEELAIRTRLHNDTNVLSLGAMFVDPEKAKRIVDNWLQTEFSHEERHERRIHEIRDIYRQESLIYEEVLENDGE